VSEGIAVQVAARFAGARTDSALLKAGLWAEELAALGYAAAAEGALTGAERAQALRFAAHEREHAEVFETLLFALTVPVREHAGDADLHAVLPGLRRAGRDAALQRLAELEEATIAAHQTLGRRLEALDALRSVATVMAGAAQHLVVLRRALEQEPVTRAFESGR
jgi:rubrerythrin